MGEYVVYVNHPNNKAFIHSTTCGFYIHRKDIDVKTGYWSTTFKTRAEAEAFANKTRKQTIRPCRNCM